MDNPNDREIRAGGVTLESELPAALFERADSSPDALFYRMPRFVVHIDDETIGALSTFYAEILFAGADVLDLMSSWVSHLPAEPDMGRVAGLGMNAQELEHNSRLTDWVVHDLNLNPILPYDSHAFDFAFIAVSIQYLTRPLEVFADLARILRPSGQLVVATSHRCFPTKAVRAFQMLQPNQRISLIAEYMRRSGLCDEPEFIDRSPPGADPLWLVRGRRPPDLAE